MLRATILLSTALLCASGATAQSGCATLTTLATATSGHKGTMFEIVNQSPTTPVRIVSFDQAFLAAGTSDVEIYSMAGSCAGFETNAAPWSLVGAASGVSHGARPQFDALPIPVNLTIAPAGTHSFYVTVTNTTANRVSYEAGTGQYGAVYAQDGNIAVVARTGMSYPFGSNFGFGGAGRLFHGRVHYCLSGTGTVLATATDVGTGCVAATGTCFYEQFAPGTHDLGHSGMSLLRSSTGFAAVPGLRAFVAPSSAAARLALTDDAEASVTLSAPLPVGRAGSAGSLVVCSNGFVSVAPGNGISGNPVVATMLGNPATAFYCWHDYDPAAVGGGGVRFEELAGVAYVTWDAVRDAGGTSAANANTFQFQFELATGHVHIVWRTMSNLGNGHLVGFSEGGASPDPGNTDLSAALPATFAAATFAVQPLALASSPRPIGGTAISLTTSNIGATAPFGAILLGINNPAVDLTPLGLAGCTQYTDNLVTRLFVPLGASSVVTPFAVPNLPGLHVFAQSAVFDPAAGLTALGAVLSQGVDHLIGDL